MDVFFWLSGFFLAYSLLPKRVRGVTAYVVVVLSRYLRLMPVYLFVLLFFWQIFPYMGSGPMWHIP